MGGAEAGYGELPYVKVEHNDDIAASQMLWPDNAHYPTSQSIRRYPGGLDAGYQPQQRPLENYGQWRRWENRCVNCYLNAGLG